MKRAEGSVALMYRVDLILSMAFISISITTTSAVRRRLRTREFLRPRSPPSPHHMPTPELSSTFNSFMAPCQKISVILIFSH
jgi:hypothetical protein